MSGGIGSAPRLAHTLSRNADARDRSEGPNPPPRKYKSWETQRSSRKRPGIVADAVALGRGRAFCIVNEFCLVNEFCVINGLCERATGRRVPALSAAPSASTSSPARRPLLYPHPPAEVFTPPGDLRHPLLAGVVGGDGGGVG